MTSNDEAAPDSESDDTRPDDMEDEVQRSAVSDELDVPSTPPDPEETAHVLPDEKLRYPEFSFDEGELGTEGKFSLSKSLDREGMREWLDELQGGLGSHDVGVSANDELAIFGVGGGDVSVSFDADEDNRGQLEFTFAVDAKLIAFSDDAEEGRAGARDGGGFIPIDMLTDDRDDRLYRCYSWIDDPFE